MWRRGDGGCGRGLGSHSCSVTLRLQEAWQHPRGWELWLVSPGSHCPQPFSELQHKACALQGIQVNVSIDPRPWPSPLELPI